VINVGMGEKQGGNLAGMESPGFAIVPFHLFSTLKKPAVDQIFPAVVQQEAGTGYAARGAKARNLHEIAFL
jgi:hypothetical protein